MGSRAASAAFALLVLTPLGQRASAAVSLGWEHYRGYYGSTHLSTGTYTVLTGFWEREALEYGVAVPYAYITGHEEVESETADEEAFIPRRGSSDTSSGLGDITASARYRFWPEEDWEPTWSISGYTKLATADKASGLGTGQNDYNLGIEFQQPLRASSLSLAIAYTHYGDSPELRLNDVYSGSAGFGWDLNNAWIGLSVFAEQPLETGAPGARDLWLYYGTSIAGREFNFFILRGFSENSPDWGYGISTTFY